MTVYIDEVFLLNGMIDYLLLLSASKLTGEPLRRVRLALAALLGGTYAAMIFLPGWGFLERPLCKLAMAVAMTLLAFGSSRRLLRVSLAFLGISAAFGGGVLALQLLSGSGVVLDLKTTLLSAAVCYLLMTLFFRRTVNHAGREFAVAELTLSGRKCRLTALVDTGNTLTDPHTGRPVMVAEGAYLDPLFPPGEGLTAAQLRDPVGTMESHQTGKGRWRLLPYRAVGVSYGLLLAVRVDNARIGREDYGSILVALSPTPVSDGGGYHALIGA